MAKFSYITVTSVLKFKEPLDTWIFTINRASGHYDIKFEGGRYNASIQNVPNRNWITDNETLWQVCHRIFGGPYKQTPSKINLN